MKAEEVEEYLWDHTEILDNGCWVFRRVTKSEYPRIVVDGVQWNLHRLSWLMFRKTELPELVHHSCENKDCWNPHHLQGMEWGAHTIAHSSKAEFGCGHPKEGSNRMVNKFSKVTGDPIYACRTCHNTRRRLKYRRR